MNYFVIRVGETTRKGNFVEKFVMYIKSERYQYSVFEKYRERYTGFHVRCHEFKSDSFELLPKADQVKVTPVNKISTQKSFEWVSDLTIKMTLEEIVLYKDINQKRIILSKDESGLKERIVGRLAQKDYISYAKTNDVELSDRSSVKVKRVRLDMTVIRKELEEMPNEKEL